MKINIIDTDHKGNGIGRIDNKITFVPKSISGDICDIDINKSYKNYDIGKINKIITQSPDRIKAKCQYYEICGGCNISNLSYSKQLEFKRNKVKNIFNKYLNIDINPSIIPSKKIYQYRNKITFHIENDKIGLIGEFDNLINIDSCLLVAPEINNILKEIKKQNLSQVNLITIKNCDNGIILSIEGFMDVKSLKDKCLSIFINDKCVYQKEEGYITINKIKYYVSDKSFFQINTSNIENLYDTILNVAKFDKNDSVLDLYCGVGSISLYISKCVKNVLGIEIIDKAIENANKNAIANNIDNVKFICEDVAKLNLEDINSNVLIVDPPRIGLDIHTKKIINKKKFSKIVYVSCDPMTLVRDIKELNNYTLENIILVDMFPQTHHVECVSLLKLK